MKRLGRVTLGLAAIGLIAGSALAQERGSDKKPATCDFKKTEKGIWCQKCDKLLEVKTDLDDKKNHKECGEKPLEVDLCVKYAASCHPSKPMNPGGS